MLGHDGAPTYVVEAIRERKYFGNKVKYLVKWQGYPEHENTWQDVSDLKPPAAHPDVWKMVQAFDDRFAARRGRRVFPRRG